MATTVLFLLCYWVTCDRVFPELYAIFVLRKKLLTVLTLMFTKSKQMFFFLIEKMLVILMSFKLTCCRSSLIKTNFQSAHSDDGWL